LSLRILEIINVNPETSEIPWGNGPRSTDPGICNVNLVSGWQQIRNSLKQRPERIPDDGQQEEPTLQTEQPASSRPSNEEHDPLSERILKILRERARELQDPERTDT
jgi:hypothetical protein